MANNYTKQLAMGAYQAQQNSNEINSGYARQETRTYNFGRNGIPAMDYNFAAPADLSQQNIDMGFILPAFCVIISCFVRCTIALVGIADMNMVLGNVSAGNQFVASGSVNALNETISQVASLPVINHIATKIWLGATPVTNTWDLATAGQWLVSITYLDYSKI